MQVKITTPAVRLALGLGQGLLVFILYKLGEHKLWPTTDPYVFMPLAFVLLFVPLVAIVGLGNLRTRTLRLWLAFLVVLITGLSVYLAYKYGEVLGLQALTDGESDPSEMSAELFFFLAAAEFRQVL